MRKIPLALLALAVVLGVAVIYAAAQSRVPALPSLAVVPASPVPATVIGATPTRAPVHNPFVEDPSFVPLTGTRAYSGEVAGAGYRIEVPQKWNGDLVLYAHGWHGGSQLTVDDLPIRTLAVQQGFAWAASSFSAGGYIPEDGVQDTLALRDFFSQTVGAPKRTYIYGTSMGGHIVVASLEQYPAIYAGGLSECGVVSGVGGWDYFAGYTLLGAYFGGVDLTAPDNHIPFVAGSLLANKIYPALGLSAGTLTDKGRQFRSGVINLSGGHRPFAAEGFATYYQTTFEAGISVVVDSSFKGKAINTTELKYHLDAGLGIDDTTLNAGVKRLSADPSARNFEKHYEFSGFKGTLKTPLLTIHDTGDMFAPIGLEQQYRATVEAAGAGSMLVQRAIRRIEHCDFSPAERGRAWTDLVAWVTSGTRPQGDDLSGSLLDVGRQWTSPLRPDDPGHP